MGQKIADDAFLIQIINDGTKLSPEKEKKLFTQLPQSLKPNAGLSLIIAKKYYKLIIGISTIIVIGKTVPVLRSWFQKSH